MASNPLKNIKLKTFRDFLMWKGLKHINTKGGHEKWTRSDINRPVIIQTHIDPVPEFIVKNTLVNIHSNVNEYIEFLKS